MIFLLTSVWQEPSEGSAVWSCDLASLESETVWDVIEWLEEHGGPEYGVTLCEWDLTKQDGLKGHADLVGLPAVIKHIKHESRYGETGTPGEYYGGTNAILDAI